MDGWHVLDLDGLEALLSTLADRGFEVIGPRVGDGAIVYEPLASAEDLPIGWSDEQDGGTYRLVRRDDEARFGYAVGPHSWKRMLFPPSEPVFSARHDGASFRVQPAPPPDRKLAFVGVRPCELAAIVVQDRVFLREPAPDRRYASRREDAFLVAVQCAEPAGTCFCVSMGTGPRASAGFDLALTELVGGEHRFVVEVGSDAGAELLEALAPRPADEDEVVAAEAVTDTAAERMGRSLDTDGIKELLYANLEHPRWDEVAERCLACGNCTMVCPTCFCTAVVDRDDLTGTHAERTRVWDSCFTTDFSYMHGGSVRTSVRSRYRQWMTHKLATWIDQFGTSGCVGCGRCITWCPVGIDLTAETAAIRADPSTPAAGGVR